ncbi:metalloprotease mig-17-like [Mercenaria mercenaria]|uniref:metalloprotease mig-17-like n=1 Tax=Mercenaria mercenaria TaxID=6596 RepID=UPI00234F3AB1|nr:metalloprotease mig-17-like [Mercenaria mercenaria]
MEKNRVGVYGTTNASFVLKFTDDKVISCKGFFISNNYIYNVHPNDVNFTAHVIYRQPHPTFDFSAGEGRILTKNVSEMEVLQHKRNVPFREKRQAQLYEIELLIVVDFALFTQLSASFASVGSEDVLEDIVHHFAIIVNGIDARFKGIKDSGYVLDVVFIGIYIAQDQHSSPWSESVTETSSTRPVVSEKSIKLLTEWIKVHQHNLPEFDHAMAFTAYNLRKQDNHKTLGLGYIQSMCTGRRFSIVEHHGDIAYVSYVATHELAHSLGAKHDGYPARVMYGHRVEICEAVDGYIMCPKASRDPDAHHRKWQFSACSILYFNFFLDYLNDNKTNCLTKRSSWHRGSDSTMYTDDYLRVYSPDEQCGLKHGTGFVLDRKASSANMSNICHSIPCLNPGDRHSVIPTLPLEGTLCGRRKVCHYGRCIDADGNTLRDKEISDNKCVFRDQPGIISGTGRTCKELLGPTNFAFRCYTYEKQCCHTCAWHRREFTAIDACPYGDRKDGCSASDCTAGITELCCETCAISAGLLKSNVYIIYFL